VTLEDGGDFGIGRPLMANAGPIPGALDRLASKTDVIAVAAAAAADPLGILLMPPPQPAPPPLLLLLLLLTRW